MKTITIATRGSRLALWQAHHVKSQLLAFDDKIHVELLVIKTKGDKILDVPLAKVGGKGLFVKEIEMALIDGRADLAVHSMKDVPAELEPGLHLAAISKREDPSDAWISKKGGLMSLPAGACVGTSSLRRACQIRNKRPDLVIENLRGNVPTRLDKLDSGNYDAIVLASAGLKRLGFGDRITERFECDTMIPAVGQGALGIETRIDDSPINEIMKKTMHHEIDALCVASERAFLLRLEGGCQAPMAAHAIVQGEQLTLQGLVGRVDGTELLKETKSGLKKDGVRLGKEVAESLLKQGADKIIEELIDVSV